MYNTFKNHIYPTPLNIIYFGGIGFLAGFMLFNQIITGLFLVMYYVIALFIFINKKVFTIFLLLYKKIKRNSMIMVNEKKEGIMLICQKQKQGIFFYGLYLLIYIINKIVLYKIKKNV